MSSTQTTQNLPTLDERSNASSVTREVFIYDSCHIIYNHRQLIGGSKYFTTKALYLLFEVSLEERRAVLTQKEKESGRALHANEEASWKTRPD